TYSRGGQVGLIAVLIVISLRSRYKAPALACLALAALLITTLAPASWMARMTGIAEGNLDESAEGRLVAWGFEWNVAKAYPLTGSGFSGYTSESLYARYEPRALPKGAKILAPHSSYFQVLGEQGFVGLLLFMVLIGCCLLTLTSLRRRARQMPGCSWVVNCSRMLDTSFLGYLVSGAFLGRAYFDLLYFIVAAVVLLKIHWTSLKEESTAMQKPQPNQMEEELFLMRA
ncbi:MAG TPA: O-antigen ligase family protein, partial [Candidatus Dormibacteraeota bacterium]|nr:O-antigen ligase family protein [Candidatus Dormibacteraeota bacterium]